MTELEALTMIAESLNGIRIELLGITFIILLFLFFKKMS
jgi:hypothetical protein